MRHNNRYMKSLRAILAALTLGLSSCGDFLDILPLNDVVLENYWTQKADVTSVLMSCYESLESESSMIRMGVWGELRSENLVQGSSIGDDYANILKENLLPSNGLCDWTVMYQTINRCNSVVYYAPQVHELDPNYTEADLQANIAEATMLRDLCYFYLIRTFRDVPITFEPSVDDQINYQIAATPMEQALDTLIADLEAVKDYAVRRYVDDTQMTNTEAASQAYENTSRVTRCAVYALLADLNLWRGNWDETVKYCDLIIDFKRDLYKTRVQNLGDQTDMMEFSGVPLILERPTSASTEGNAYYEIFGLGSSFESIFELYFLNGQSVQNTYVSNYYGNSSTTLGRFATSEQHIQNAVLGNSDLYSANDCRVYENVTYTQSKYTIRKYVNQNVSLTVQNVTDESSLRLTTSIRSQNYSNWIIYRLTDIMLMKAEALAMKGGQSDLETAFCMVNAVNKRARSITTTASSDTLVMSNYDTKEKMEELVMDERNRELMFEGKRWYDLVRVSLRDQSTRYLVEQATVKYKDNVNAMKIKLSDLNIIFFPYSEDELTVNPNLTQNSAYSKNDDYNY